MNQITFFTILFFFISVGAVQVSRDQDGGRGEVCQMITLDHRGEGGSQQNDHASGGGTWIPSMYFIKETVTLIQGSSRLHN